MAQNHTSDTEPGAIGFIGLGQQGAPMAANLVAAGYNLVVSDRDLERERSFVAQHGCRVGFDAPLAPLVRDQFADALDRLGDPRADLSRSIEDWELRGEVRVPAPRT